MYVVFKIFFFINSQVFIFSILISRNFELFFFFVETLFIIFNFNVKFRCLIRDLSIYDSKLYFVETLITRILIDLKKRKSDLNNEKLTKSKN